MPNTLLVKRTTVAGRVPTTAQLAAGELAVNVTDGKLYLKKATGGVESIVDVTSAALTDAQIFAKVTAQDGAGSGLDADLLDGAHASAFALLSGATFSGTVTAPNFVSSSDARLKTDVETVSDALDRVRKLRGVTFTRRDTGSRGIGIVAQELAPIVPEAVMTHDDGLMSVAYGNLVGLLIEAIKELADQTKLQAQAIANLEAQR